MSAAVLRCTEGDVTVAIDGAPLCSGYWSQIPVPEPFDISLMDPVLLGQMWLIGFVLVGSIWFAGWCIRILLSMIK